ncbi:lytic transglycosylase domain-containing protein [Mesorhizobium sp. 2RAF21]|uniref:lytic transglycosylase domain-containing protein n=1 Tax=Mesorhizobium sp. 2RAF21 TaxID=3232995 RepID=UPI003F94359A
MSTLVAAGLIANHAKGQDSSQDEPFIPKYVDSSAASNANDNVVKGVFERRWDTTSVEYVLDPDGRLARPNARAKAASKGKQFGAFDSLSDVSVASRNYIITDIYGGGAWPLSTSSDPVDRNVSECGPSPVEPAGIKALVEEAANRLGVDPGFAVAIVATESDFDRDRNSPKGARGPMQLMPATADRFDVEDVCDPAANIDGGVRYLRTLLDEFGNPLLAAAAYNAGEKRIYEYGGIPPFAETVSYIAKVVNHQLGLSMPAARKARAPRVADDARGEVGVIAPKKTGSFVAGVMHF